MKRKLAWLLVLVLALGLAGCTDRGGSVGGATKKPEVYFPYAIGGAFDEDGNAVVPTMDGEVFEVKGEIDAAQITPDRSKVVYLEDGMLYYRELATDERTRIASDADEDFYVTDAGVLFSDEAGETLCRYLFADGETLKTGVEQLNAFGWAGKNLNAAYAADDKVYYVGEDSTEPERIGSYDGRAAIEYVAKNGSFVVWSDTSGSAVTLYCWENGERTKIGEFESSSWYAYCYVLADQSEQYFTATCVGSEVMFFKRIGEDAVKIKLPDKLSNLFPMTPQGRFDYVTYDPAGGFYVLSGDALYWIDSEGEREKAASDIDSYAAVRGWIYTLDKDGNLRAGPAAGSELELEKIAGDVGTVRTTAIGSDVIYYLRDVSDSYGTLYALEVGGAEPVKVTGDVYSSYLTYGTDGKSIYFFKDCDSIPGTTSYSAGTLYRYTYGDESPEKISGDVVVGYPESGYCIWIVEADCFLYRKAPEYRDGRVFFNWMYYDGAESTRLAGDVSF